MSIIEAYRLCFTKYAVFSGRARRNEYWMFYLANILIGLFLSVLGLILLKTAEEYIWVALVLGLLYTLAVFLPGLAVTVRRLHDTDHSGAAVLLALIPLVGAIILLVFLCKDGTPGSNRYGENPKEPISDSKPAGAIKITQNTDDPSSGNTVPLRRKAVLLVDCVEGADKGAHAEGELVYVGRDERLCQLILRNTPSVSRRHCMIHLNGGRIELMDLNSTNGTYLANGKKLSPNETVTITNGSKILLGSDAAVFIGAVEKNVGVLFD